ncbi:hypothetical protein [uncultured Flavobacterium sp.]|uniref:hypothetical protein n=1 Tax=uncultured Flavobacterium sp. TaxID=165435 RepID=UPI0025F65950|nr:hypothetical protein [uncultured Flavobacterium sp.]
MPEKLKHFPVNWIDGMKISKIHFLGMQENVDEAVKEAVSVQLTSINYGLLPIMGNSNSIKMNLIVDNHKLLKVKIDECRAITSNGFRIEIDKETDSGLDSSLTYPEAVHAILPGEKIGLLACISVNNKKRIPFGELDPDENPPRYPFTQPEYLLHLIPEENIRKENGLGNSFLTIGRIMVSDTETSIDESYIPPSTTVNSHASLLEDYTDLDKFYGQIEIYANQISQKINSKNQNNILSQLLESICDKTLNYLGHEINAFRWFTPNRPPAYMYNSVIAFARIIKNHIDSRSGSGKEELLNYFSEWCNISQGDFELLFNETINIGYNHSQIDKTSSQVFKFTKTIEELFSILTRLDYIGKRKDGSIYVTEINDENQKIVTNARRNRTFIND